MTPEEEHCARIVERNKARAVLRCEVDKENEIEREFQKVAWEFIHTLKCDLGLPLNVNAFIEFPLSGLKATLRIEVQDARKSPG